MRSVRDVLAGRWQFPAAVAAVVTAALAVHRLRPAPQPFDFDGAMNNLLALRDFGRFVDATNGAANLLTANAETLNDAQRAALDAFLVESIYRMERDNPTPRPGNARLIILHDQQATAAGAAADPARTRMVALAHEWLGQPLEAVARYQEVLRGEVSGPLRLEAQAAVARLLEGRGAQAAQRDAALSAILSDESAPDSLASWALTGAARDALCMGDLWKLRDLLTRFGDRFRRGPLRGFGAYLDGLLALAEGRPLVAETLAHYVDDWLAQHAERPDPGLESALSELLAANHALAGEALLALGRGEESVARFEQAVQFETSPPQLQLLRIRLATALACVQRPVAEVDAALHPDGLEPKSPVAASEALYATSRQLLCEALREAGLALGRTGRFDEARSYFTLLLRQIPQEDGLARLVALETAARLAGEAADAASDAASMRRNAADSGRLYERAADAADLDDTRVTANLWLAADEFQRSGAAEEYVQVLERFVEGRRYDARYPKALWRLAQAHELRRDLDSAVQRYREIVGGFDNLPEAMLARVATARCIAERDPRDLPSAIAALELLLDAGETAPESLAFREALSTLGTLLHAAGEYARAISRLEDMRAYFPNDPDRVYTQFLLADAYRRSAIELRDRGEGDTWRERLRAAVGRYGELLGDVRGDSGLPADEYRRLAMLHRGDCLLELNDPDSLNEALATFQQAALAYEGQSAALIAHVRTASIYLRLGRVLEAARVLERARWLVGSMPDDAFAGGTDGFSVRNWREYLALVRESSLFRAAPEAR